MYNGAVRKVSRQDIKVVNVSMETEDNDYLYKECVYAGGGPSQYITWLSGDKTPLHDVMGFRKEINGITMEIALQWYAEGYSNTMLGYANAIHTIDGGTHIDGVKASITRTINSLAKKLKLVKEEDITLSEEHVKEGLTCIVSVSVPNPEFEGQKQRRLGNPYIREIVDKSVQEYLTEYFELHPDVLKKIFAKSFNAYKNALVVKRAREVIRSESVSTIPERLPNSSSGTFEIVIAIGESSGGAAQHGHDRRLQSKRTREQPRSNGAVSSAPPGRSLENTSESAIDKKRQKVVASTHPSRRDGVVVCTAPGKPLENVSVKTLKGVSPGSNRPNRKNGSVETLKGVSPGSNGPNRKNVSVKTVKGVSPGSNKTKPVIPVGPSFQAEIPVWIAPTKKGKFYGSPGDSDTLRWLGSGVWPIYSLKEKVFKKKVGEGRADSCSCATPGTTTCIKLHIEEARELLEKESGSAFYTWKFDEMGEVGSKSWTAKEEQKFEALVKNKRLSSCDGFWKFALKSFPKRSEKDLISYYYNVFLNHRTYSDDDHYGDFLAG